MNNRMVTRKRFIKKRRPSEEMVLQITSMADIFMIIIVFLLKTFSTGALDISASANMTLPVASSIEEVKEALKVEVTSSAIILNSKVILDLKSFKVKSSDGNLDLDQAGGLIKLTEAFSLERKKMLETGARDLASDSALLVLADQKVPYRLLKSVIASGAQNGFTDLRLIVVEEP